MSTTNQKEFKTGSTVQEEKKLGAWSEWVTNDDSGTSVRQRVIETTITKSHIAGGIAKTVSVKKEKTLEIEVSTKKNAKIVNFRVAC